MKSRLALSLSLLASTALSAQGHELQLMALQQAVGASGNLPATTYRPLALLYVYEPSRSSDLPVFQWAFGFGMPPSQEASYRAPGISDRYKPGSFLSLGFRIQSPGAFRVGVGLDLRAGTDTRESFSGDIAGGGDSAKARVWANLHARYSPQRAGLAPVFGAQWGASTGSDPTPHREWGLFAGVRF